MFFHYIKVAFRNLWKYKIQNIIGIIGLSVGFLVFAVCCFIIRYFFAFDTQYPGADRIYYTGTENSTTVKSDFFRFRDYFPEIEKITTSAPEQTYYAVLSREKEEVSIRLALQEVDTLFIDFFSLEILEGNRQTILHTANSLVLFESFANKWEIYPGVTVLMDETAYQVTGILKDLPKNTSIAEGQGFILNKTDGFYHQYDHTVWDPSGHSAYIMLRKGYSQKDLQQKFDHHDFVFESLSQEVTDRMGLRKLTGRVTSDTKAMAAFIALFIIGLLVFLTALFNYISFQTARFFNRLRECAVRKVNGAGRWRQLFLFYAEVAVVFIISALLALVLLELLRPVIGHSEFGPVMQRLNPDALRIQLIKYALAGLFIAFLLCIIPANTVNRKSTRFILMGLSEKGKKSRWRNVLMFVQMIILLMFLSASLIVRLQSEKVKEHIFSHLTEEEQKNILTAVFRYQPLIENEEAIISKLKSFPGISDVTFSAVPLVSYGFPVTKDVELPGLDKISATEYKVGPEFCTFFNVRMVNGNFFDQDTSQDVIIVDETFASLFPDKDPVGVVLNGAQITGVIENVQTAKRNKRAQIKNPVIYSYRTPNTEATIYVKVMPDKKEEAQKHLTQVVREFIPVSLEFNSSDLNEDIKSLFETENALFLFTSIFTFIALILGLLSIYSAVFMNTEKRKKEVSLRKINGAEIKDIITLFGKSYVILWTLACLTVFPLIYKIAKIWIERFDQQISLHIGLFMAIYLCVLILIAFTVVFQILKVARINPAEVLKVEN